MHHEVCPEVNRDTMQVRRYPWKLLRIGDTMTVACPQPEAARLSIYRHAKKRGWKVQTVRNGGTITVCRDA